MSGEIIYTATAKYPNFKLPFFILFRSFWFAMCTSLLFGISSLFINNDNKESIVTSMMIGACIGIAIAVIRIIREKMYYNGLEYCIKDGVLEWKKDGKVIRELKFLDMYYVYFQVNWMSQKNNEYLAFRLIQENNGYQSHPLFSKKYILYQASMNFIEHPYDVLRAIQNYYAEKRNQEGYQQNHSYDVISITYKDDERVTFWEAYHQLFIIFGVVTIILMSFFNFYDTWQHAVALIEFGTLGVLTFISFLIWKVETTISKNKKGIE